MPTSSLMIDFIELLRNGLRFLVELLLPSFAQGFNQPWFNQVTGVDVMLAALLGAVTLTSGFALHHLLRKKAHPANSEMSDWGSSLIRAARKPLYLVFWFYSAYLSLLPVVSHLRTESERHPVQAALERGVEVGLFAAIIWLYFQLVLLVEARIKRRTRQTSNRWDDLFLPLLIRSLRVVAPVMAIILALPLLDLPPDYERLLSKSSSLLVIGAVAWVLTQAVVVGEKVILTQFDISTKDNLRARQVYTQVHVLRKILFFIIILFAAASILMLFEEVRRLGASILASAGVMGIIIGFAAQKTIANLFAGVQIALTQPIRLDDVVIVENEWGRIEEIALTYVVVRIWDLRRLVVPINYFIEHSFQNWTRVSADILGTVFLYFDYTVPVEEVRLELQRIVKRSPHWDGKVVGLQVTNANERTVELRALASASDASKAWDLRCEIREKLLDFVQRTHPESLPRLRTLSQMEGKRGGDEAPSGT